MTGHLSLVCLVDALTPAERVRQRELTAQLSGTVAAIRELHDGWAFDLDRDPVTFCAAAEWIALERCCCPFLTFGLEWSGASVISLRLTGSPPAKDFIRDTFAALGPAASPGS
jgi:hypothetical protein